MVTIGNNYNSSRYKYKDYVIVYEIRNAISDPTNIRIFYNDELVTNRVDTIEEAMKYIDLVS